MQRSNNNNSTSSNNNNTNNNNNFYEGTPKLHRAQSQIAYRPRVNSEKTSPVKRNRERISFSKAADQYSLNTSYPPPRNSNHHNILSPTPVPASNNYNSSYRTTINQSQQSNYNQSSDLDTPGTPGDFPTIMDSEPQSRYLKPRPRALSLMDLSVSAQNNFQQDLQHMKLMKSGIYGSVNQNSKSSNKQNQTVRPTNYYDSTTSVGSSTSPDNVFSDNGNGRDAKRHLFRKTDRVSSNESRASNGPQSQMGPPPVLNRQNSSFMINNPGTQTLPSSRSNSITRQGPAPYLGRQSSNNAHSNEVSMHGYSSQNLSKLRMPTSPMSTSGLNSAGIPNSMSQSFSNKARTPTADHPPSVALNRSNRKFSRSQSSLTEKDIQRRRNARQALVDLQGGAGSFQQQEKYNQLSKTTNIPRSRESSVDRGYSQMTTGQMNRKLSTSRRGSTTSLIPPLNPPQKSSKPIINQSIGSRQSLNTSDGGYRSGKEQDSVDSTARSPVVASRRTSSVSRQTTADQSNQQIAIRNDKNKMVAVSSSSKNSSENNNNNQQLKPLDPKFVAAQNNQIALTTNSLVLGLNETKKDLVKLEKNSRRILQGVVGRVEPFANSVNKIVMDNSRLKQEVTWLYREMDFMREKMMQQQEVINLLLQKNGMGELVSIVFKVFYLFFLFFWRSNTEIYWEANYYKLVIQKHLNPLPTFIFNYCL